MEARQPRQTLRPHPSPLRFAPTSLARRHRVPHFHPRQPTTWRRSQGHGRSEKGGRWSPSDRDERRLGRGARTGSHDSHSPRSGMDALCHTTPTLGSLTRDARDPAAACLVLARQVARPGRLSCLVRDRPLQSPASPLPKPTSRRLQRVQHRLKRRRVEPLPTSACPGAQSIRPRTSKTAESQPTHPKSQQTSHCPLSSSSSTSSSKPVHSYSTRADQPGASHRGTQNALPA